jgi:hypothetical protein
MEKTITSHFIPSHTSKNAQRINLSRNELKIGRYSHRVSNATLGQPEPFINGLMETFLFHISFFVHFYLLTGLKASGMTLPGSLPPYDAVYSISHLEPQTLSHVALSMQTVLLLIPLTICGIQSYVKWSSSMAHRCTSFVSSTKRLEKFCIIRFSRTSRQSLPGLSSSVLSLNGTHRRGCNF